MLRSEQLSFFFFVALLTKIQGDSMVQFVFTLAVVYTPELRASKTFPDRQWVDQNTLFAAPALETLTGHGFLKDDFSVCSSYYPSCLTVDC